MDNFIERINEKINIQEIIKTRLEELLSEEYQSKRVIIDGADKSISGFFKPNEVVEVFVDYGYKFDDNEVYVDLIQLILDLKENNPDQDIRNIMIAAVKTTVINYFRADKTDYKNYIKNLYSLFDDCDEEIKVSWRLQLDYAKEVAEKKGLTGNEVLEEIELQAREWYAPFLARAGEGPSIKKIKALGFAKCVEHAAMTNQLFNFLGIQSIYVENSLVDERGTDGHAYNIREGATGPVLVDYLNDTSIRLESREQAERLMNCQEAVYDSKNNVCYGVGYLAKKKFEYENPIKNK